MIFKTPSLKNWADLYLSNNLNLYSKKDELYALLSDIELPDPHPNYEHYYQYINLFDGSSITIVWNIDKILSESSIIPKEKHSVYELSSLIDLSDIAVKNELKRLKPKGYIKHKSDLIVLALFPTVSDFTIIDGNHKVLENIDNPHYVFDCCILGDDIMLKYLEPNSRKFAEVIYYLQTLLLS